MPCTESPKKLHYVNGIFTEILFFVFIKKPPLKFLKSLPSVKFKQWFLVFALNIANSSTRNQLNLFNLH